jgi:crotonobetainyl-CoA:carnitine CoA-transferase CaiB-like acyl-CoA transferase
MPVSAFTDVAVVECATYVTGPYATALLADLGARVIEIEAPPDGDPYRYLAPGEYYSPNFAHLNRNQESISLDLKALEGERICLGLARKADVCARCPACQTAGGHFLSRACTRIEP